VVDNAGQPSVSVSDPEAATAFDVVVLGAGSGGYACALRAAQLGLRVALVEEDKLGGTCLHRGCIPTKALLHSAEVADTVTHSGAFGVLAALTGVDVPAVRAYRDGVVDRLFKGLTGLIKGRGITVVHGRGRLSGPRSVLVESADPEIAPVELTGGAVVVATGSVPRLIPGIEVDGEQMLTSDDAVALARIPARAVVIGGGVIGCEFASMWRSLGAQVTVVEALPRLLPTEEPASSKVLERSFRKRGIAMKTGITVAGVDRVDAEGRGTEPTDVRLRLSDGGELLADTVLIATGRAPRTDGIGLAEQGVKLDRGFVLTDPLGRTGVEGLFAVGDIVPGLQLAHRGFAQGIVVAEVIAGQSPAPVRDELVPRVTYCVPEVASVGLTSEQAEERYGADAVLTLTYDLGGNGKSQILRTQGHALLVRRVDGPVVGIHLVGERVGELIGEAQLIVGWEAHPDDVAALIHAHPTQNEALGEAHLALAGKALHAHA
jgi:dihydrolipoamide dehydrogenase